MRRETAWTVAAEGRDKGKLYHLREMPVVPAEAWFMRAMQMLVRAGIEVPPNIFEQGAQGFVIMGIGACLTGLGKAPYDDYKILMDDMLTCLVGYQEAPGSPKITNFNQIMEQTEEVATLVKLREEIISLHLGFSLAAKLQTYREAVAALINKLGLSI